MAPGRNDPCPCGSGKKYKRCCGLQAARIDNELPIEKARMAYEHGDFRETLRLCREILVVNPQEPTANHLSGLAELQHGNFQSAIKYLQTALRARPRDPFIHNSHGMLLHRSGNWSDAEKEFRMALEIEPSFAEAHNNLGNLLRDMHRLEEATVHLRQAVALDEANVLFICNLGALFQGCKEYVEAEHCYIKAIEIVPGFSPAYGNLGVLYLQQDRLEDAVNYLHKAESLSPSDPQILNNLGQAWYRLRNYERSIEYYRRVKAISPRFVPALINLGLALEAKGEYAEASATYREAIRLEPDFVQAYQNYFNIVLSTGAVDEAHELARSVLGNSELRNLLLPELMNVFGQVCDFGRRDEIFCLFQERARSNHVSAETMRRVLLTTNYVDGVNPSEIFEYHRYWAQDLESHVRQAGGDRSKRLSHESKLRIGYISPDFREHSVGYFVRHIIANHDKSRFVTYCYANSRKRDAITQFIETHSDHFKTVVHLSDDELFEVIVQDKIDILVDLAGHTGESRLPVFSYKPASVQISYLGYPNTTALTAMDYRISDSYADNVPSQEFMEKILVLPECFISFGGFDDLVDSTHLAPRSDKRVIFGSFNNLMKITPRVVRLWSTILAQVPDSRLLIKAKCANAAVTRKYLLEEFGRHGIEHDRIETVEMMLSNQEHREYYRNLDIALDTFPYQGTTTTCEALWMGVPVVILVGELHRQRVGYSILKNAGIEETIAYTEDEYVTVAVNLAKERDSLEKLRHDIHTRLRASILCNPARFTRQLEAAYLQAWDSCAAARTS